MKDLILISEFYFNCANNKKNKSHEAEIEIAIEFKTKEQTLYFSSLKLIQCSRF